MKKLIILTVCVAFLVFPVLVFAQEDDSRRLDPCAECPYPLVGKNVYIQNDVGYFMLSQTIALVFDDFYRACMVFDRYNINKIVIIINSPGGNLFEGIAFAQKMIEQINKGKIIEVRGYGLVASAAAIIMASGSEGYRYVAPNTVLMIHELQVYEWGASVKDVSAKEKEAMVVRFLQDNVNDFLLPHIKLSKKALKEKCEDESWGDAQTAIEWGFADKIIQ